MGNPGFVENVPWLIRTDQLFLSPAVAPGFFARFIRSIIALSEKLKSPFMETLHVLSVILNPAGTHLH